MRISTRKEDAGYFGYVSGITVSLDGIEVKDCIMADDALGECLVYSRDDSGNLKVVNGEIPTKTLLGKVEINIPPELDKYLRGAK